MGAWVFRSKMAAALAAVCLFALASEHTVDATSYSPQITASVSDATPGQAADLHLDFHQSAPDYNFDAIVTFIPAEFFFAPGGDIPDGAVVGRLQATVRLGLLNGPCITELPVTFELLDASTNTANTLDSYYGYSDNDFDGLPENVEAYPEFLTRAVPDVQPIERLYGSTLVAGVGTYVNFLVFPPGTSIPRLPAMDASLGYPVMIFLNNSLAPAINSNINDFCTPLTANVVNYGTSRNNPLTNSNAEAGHDFRRNPANAGDYNVTSFVRSQWDAERDGIENKLDPCPYSSDPTWDPREHSAADADTDGVPPSCDPSSNGTPDLDGDSYSNRLDDCPLVTNYDQRDSDLDGIGDACDEFPADASEGGSAIRHQACAFSTIQIGNGGPAAEPPACPSGPDNPVVPRFQLYPERAVLPVDTVGSVEAAIYDPLTNAPVPAVLVEYVVTGTNATSGSCLTNNSGYCTFNYSGDNLGEDTVTATASPAGHEMTRTATITWVTPPSNDAFAQATPVTVLPFETDVQTAGASTESNENLPCGYGPSLWYEYTPQSTVYARAEIEVEGGSGVLSIYEGSTLNDLELVGCSQYGSYYSDDDVYAFALLEAGKTYQLRIGTYSYSPFIGAPIPLELGEVLANDTDCNDLANGQDVLRSLASAVDAMPPPPCLPAGDYNCNFDADMTDVAAMLKGVAGQPQSLAPCPLPFSGGD